MQSTCSVLREGHNEMGDTRERTMKILTQTQPFSIEQILHCAFDFSNSIHSPKSCSLQAVDSSFSVDPINLQPHVHIPLP